MHYFNNDRNCGNYIYDNNDFDDKFNGIFENNANRNFDSNKQWRFSKSTPREEIYIRRR